MALVVFLLLARPALAQTPTPAPTGAPRVYVVQPGDTLYRIAEYFDTTVSAIVDANGLEDPRLIAPGQRLIIPAVQTAPLASEYVVQPGDTLSRIAQQFDTTVEALVAANQIANPALIEVGQKLIIPGGAAAPAARPEHGLNRRLHVVRAAETLPFLAFRYGTTEWALRGANHLDPLGLIFAGQELTIPAPVALTSSTPRFPEVTTSPSPLAQGQTLVVRVRGRDSLEVKGSFLGKDLVFFSSVGEYWALAGVDPLQKPGSYPLALSVVESGSGDRLSMQQTVVLAKGSFVTVNIDVPEDRQSLLDPKLSVAEAVKVNRVFAQVSPLPQWQGVFTAPLTGELYPTSSFGERRSYSGGPVASYHAGIDLGADAGAPIYATADGTVVLAEQLQVRGNAVILDHGLGVLTGFWHLSQIDVKVGQVVKKGDRIGLVGNTGLSTGPHLHWEMRVRSVAVDPMQWTRQVFP